MSCPRVTRPDRRPEGLPEGRPDRRRWCRVPRWGRSRDPLALRGCGTCASRPQTGHAQGDVVLVPVCAMVAVPDAFGAFTEAKVASLVVALGAAVAGKGAGQGSIGRGGGDAHAEDILESTGPSRRTVRRTTGAGRARAGWWPARRTGAWGDVGHRGICQCPLPDPEPHGGDPQFVGDHARSGVEDVVDDQVRTVCRPRCAQRCAQVAAADVAEHRGQPAVLQVVTHEGVPLEHLLGHGLQ